MLRISLWLLGIRIRVLIFLKLLLIHNDLLYILFRIYWCHIYITFNLSFGHIWNSLPFRSRSSAHISTLDLFRHFQFFHVTLFRFRLANLIGFLYFANRILAALRQWEMPIVMIRLIIYVTRLQVARASILISITMISRDYWGYSGLNRLRYYPKAVLGWNIPIKAVKMKI